MTVMHWMQISLELEQNGSMSAEARRQGVSIVEMVRAIVEDGMRSEQTRDPFACLAGAGEGDGRYSGADHDRVLYGDGCA